MLREVTEVTIARNQCNVVVDAGLGDQGIADASFEAAALQSTARYSGASPVALMEFENENLADKRLDCGGAGRIAEDFCYHDRGEREIAGAQRGGEQVYVSSG